MNFNILVIVIVVMIVKQNDSMKLIQKRDLSFSYAATDIGTKAGTHFKTLTVVKNVGKHLVKKPHDIKTEDEEDKKLHEKNEKIFEELFSKIFDELPKNSDSNSESKKKTEEKTVVEVVQIPKEEAKKVEEPKVEISKDDKDKKPVSEALVEENDEKKNDEEKKEEKPAEEFKFKYLFTPADELLLEQALKEEKRKEIEEFKSKAIEASHAKLSAKAQDKYWKKQKRQSELFNDYLKEKEV